jgi:hypothetical protein
VRKTVESA